MNNDISMFCRQCQETFGNTGCQRVGVCGKKPKTAQLMDRLVAGLVELAAEKDPTPELGRFVAFSLFLTLTNANFDDRRLEIALDETVRLLGHEPVRSVPAAFCEADPDLRSLKELLLFGLKGVAAYTFHAAELGEENAELYTFVLSALAATGEEKPANELTGLVLDCGMAAVKAMALLDSANTGAFGKPVAGKVNLGVGSHPGILVSGHDLLDLKELLEQTKDKGLDIYTHGEMLPAHHYPALRAYHHLKGNYGDAWYNQQKDFASFNGAILMTSNCIVPVLPSYSDRIFTTGVAGYPGVPHIADRTDGNPKDFSPLIERALRCAPPVELEQGEIVGGFAHDQLLLLRRKLVAAVKARKIKRFVVMAGCDGRHRTRDYYAQVARGLPHDAVILTAGCAKYRYIKLVHREIDGIPSVIDAGQCNDSYSLVVTALALRDAFGKSDVNDIPISFDIAWYEQKAVAVLLALLALGFRNIRLGPTLPAFLSDGVAKTLSERFGLRGIGNAVEDIKAIMGPENR